MPRGPSAADEAWARSLLSDAEVELWARQSRVDRRHAVGVARLVEAERFDEAWVVPAALLHDIGKTVAGLGTYGRVVATLSERWADDTMAQAWSMKKGFTRRVGLYLRYPELGVDLLRMAGSDDRVIAWSREHHLPPEGWTVPAEAGEALARADDRA